MRSGFSKTSGKILRTAVMAMGCALILSACVRFGKNALVDVADWKLKSTMRLKSDELWKEHDGADQIYIQNGCRLETIRNYDHAARPWSARTSVFAHKSVEGAAAIFDYYREGIENEVEGVQPIGDRAYMWQSKVMRAWIVGFQKDNHFVEVALREETPEETPMSRDARRATLEIAQTVAASL